MAGRVEDRIGIAHVRGIDIAREERLVRLNRVREVGVINRNPMDAAIGELLEHRPLDPAISARVEHKEPERIGAWSWDGEFTVAASGLDTGAVSHPAPNIIFKDNRAQFVKRRTITDAEFCTVIAVDIHDVSAGVGEIEPGTYLEA